MKFEIIPAEKKPDKILAISPSSLDTYAECPRKWGHVYIGGAPRVTSAAQKLGLDYHDITAEYLRTGELPNDNKRVTKMLRAALPLLPMPKQDDCFIEQKIYLKYKDIWLQGTMDYTRPLHLIDHKTTSAWGWVKTEDQLQKDPQAIVYNAIHDTLFDLQGAKLEWIYVVTKGKPAAKSTSIILEDSDKKIMIAVDIAAYLIKCFHDKKDVFSFEPNLDSCSNYGGCPFKELCNLSATQTIKTLFNGEKRKKEVMKQLTMKEQIAMLKARQEGNEKEKGVNPPTEVEEKTPLRVTTSDSVAATKEKINKKIDKKTGKEIEITKETGVTVVEEPFIKEPAAEEKPKKADKKKTLKAEEKTFLEEIKTVIKECMQDKGGIETPINSGVLYLDCYPVKFHAPIVNFSDFAQPYIDLVSKAMKRYYKVAPYNEGSVLLAEMIDKAFKDKPEIKPVFLYVDSNIVNGVVLEILIKHYDYVIKGL